VQDHDESPEDFGAQGVVGGDFGEEGGGGVGGCEGAEVDGHFCLSFFWCCCLGELVMWMDGWMGFIVVATFRVSIREGDF